MTHAQATLLFLDEDLTTLVVTGEPWSAAETLRLLREERITVGTGVPTQWQMVLAHPDLARTDAADCG